MNDERSDALGDELRRIEESATHSGQSQFEQSKFWRGTNLFVGGPAAILAAVSGATGLAAASNRTTAAVLALIAAGLGAVVTTLNAASRADRAHVSANAYLAIQTEARQLRLLDLDRLGPDEARDRVGDLTTRLQEINSAAEIPSQFAYRRGNRNINKGGQTYGPDA